MSSDAEALAELEARMAAPDYRPTLGRPSVIARLLNVSQSAVSNWAADSERTGVRRHDGQFYDLNECVRWVLKRNESKVTARRRTG